MEAKRNGTQSNCQQNQSQSSKVSGVRQVSLPSANTSIVTSNPFASLHIYLDNNEEFAASHSALIPFESSHTVFNDNTPAAKIMNKSGGQWALYDTGATHYMFKSNSLFSSSSLVKLDDSSKRLKLAAGDVSLAVHSNGTVQLKSGSGKLFELNNSLYVPEIAQNLLAGGAMLRKGVEVLIHPNDSNCFSLVFNGEALFNGAFAANNLMYVSLEPVSPFPGSTAACTSAEDISCLQHRRLGHLSNRYLNIMCKHGSVERIQGDLTQLKDCSICSLSKNTKVPHSSTRPRAIRHLENVHVDISGIIRTKGLKNEMYYALFCDDISSFCHIFFMQSKSKEEV